MAGVDVGEQLHHDLRHLEADALQPVQQAGFLQHAAHEGMARKVPDLEGRADGRTEQEVLGERGVDVVGARVEGLDGGGRARRVEAGAECGAGFQHPFGEARMGVRVEYAAQAQRVEVVVEADGRQHLHHPARHLPAGGGAGGLVIHPVRAEIGVAVAGAPGLGRPGLAAGGLFRAGVGGAEGAVAQAEQQVLAHGGVEEAGARPDIGRLAPEHRLRQVGERGAVQMRAPAGDGGQPGGEQAELLLAAAARADDGDMFAQAERQGGAAHRLGNLVLRISSILKHEPAFRPDLRQGLGLLHLQCLVDHAGRIELLDDLVVFDARVGLLLVVGQQLLPGRGHVLVGGEHGDHGAEAEAALDDQVAADGVEEEGGELRQEIVEELDEELAPEDLVADVVDAAEAVGNVGAQPVGAVIGVDGLDGRDRLADPVGQPAHMLHALLGERGHPALELRDRIHLERVERERGKAQDGLLDQHERADGDEDAELVDRLRQRIAHEAAERLDLLRHHRDDLALARALEHRQREAQQARIEVVAQPAQQPFAEAALAGVDGEFERAVQEHEAEEGEAQHHQILDLPELQPEQRPGEARAADGVVDDLLGQFERDVEHREGRHGEREQEELLRQAVAEHEAVDRLFHADRLPRLDKPPHHGPIGRN